MSKDVIWKDVGQPLTDAQVAELAALEAMPDSEIDLSDIPEKLDWSDAVRGPLTPELRCALLAKRDARRAAREAAE